MVVTRPAYGFRYNEARDALVVCEPEMVVEKVFRLAADGLGQCAIQTRLFREGVPSPTGKPEWDWSMIKRIVYNDAFRRHTFEEISVLVAAEVAAALDPDREYGVQWYNRQRVTERTISEPDPASPGERRYRKTRTTQTKSGYRYYYYFCHRGGKRVYACTQKCLRAEKAVATVWSCAGC